MSAWLTIIGVGEAGIAALPATSRNKIATAETVLGAERFLHELTPAPNPSPQGGGEQRAAAPSPPSPLRGRIEGGGSHQKIVPWTPPLEKMLDQIRARRGTPTVILATGDPNWFGIGATLAKELDPDEIDILPHPSAFQLAAAKLGWPLQHIVKLSLHGRAVETLHPHILPGNRVLALTSDHTTLAAVIEILIGRGYGETSLTVLENLGGSVEKIHSARADSFADEIGDFYVLALDCVAGAQAPLLPQIPGLPDDAFMSDGQLTKREVRAASLAKLAPFPGALLWDVGAGCGSVGIEWLRAARDTRAICFERDVERLEMIALNGRALGTPTLKIIAGEAPESLVGQPAPDAIFLGGDVGSEPLFNACWSALKPGGRLVANAVTLDGEQALYARQQAFGGEIARLDISILDTIGDHRVLRPRMAVTQWLGIKP